MIDDLNGIPSSLRCDEVTSCGHSVTENLVRASRPEPTIDCLREIYKKAPMVDDDLMPMPSALGPLFPIHIVRIDGDGSLGIHYHHSSVRLLTQSCLRSNFQILVGTSSTWALGESPKPILAILNAEASSNVNIEILHIVPLLAVVDILKPDQIDVASYSNDADIPPPPPLVEDATLGIKEDQALEMQMANPKKTLVSVLAILEDLMESMMKDSVDLGESQRRVGPEVVRALFRSLGHSFMADLRTVSASICPLISIVGSLGADEERLHELVDKIVQDA
ncbi:hypothetical protein AMTR_s00060p00201910 [Amborella trichopoda]|uniref:Uncharacterized protein n=1 Tax=Amborella trichopoda TaxID=13333 RepID=W1NKE6_AMBTC|nr:hypothetical protein AMTR_s00060p00201910 [Amborella trichopoda]